MALSLVAAGLALAASPLVALWVGDRVVDRWEKQDAPLVAAARAVRGL
jgi:hypothetical protein